jgi:hypothetical protein
MSKRPYRWKWTAQIQRETLVELQDLADSLGFVVEAPGHYFGAPSPSSLLDSIATAHRRDPEAVRDALRALGVFWQPEPPEDNVPDTPSS